MNLDSLNNKYSYSNFLPISLLTGCVLMIGWGSPVSAQCPIEEVFLPSSQPTEFSKINGRKNNLDHRGWGAAGKPLIRLKQLNEIVIGKDQTRDPEANNDLPNARLVSSIVARQNDASPNTKGLSDMFWLWGQFLDHDITLVHTDEVREANITIPDDDYFYSQHNITTLPINRSKIFNSKVGRHPNAITSYIDASQVYGSYKGKADDTPYEIRSFKGGKLRIEPNGLLPKDDGMFFTTGDVRGNENIALTAMHTLWVREHNLIADALACKHPRWNDKRIFREARRIVIAEIQAITYNEFLPALLGRNALPSYMKNSSGYDEMLKVNISNVFSTAAYRFGHSMLPPSLLLSFQDGHETSSEYVPLPEAFMRPEKVESAGIAAILLGAATQAAKAVDPMVDHSIHNLLFQIQGEPHGHDLAAFNIWRGRDHQIPSYNDVREALGFGRITSFDDRANKWQRGFGERLEEAYDGDVDKIDLWVGGLAEKAAGNALVGKTFKAILLEQFSRLRRGDRFWYENTNYYDHDDIAQFKKIKLSDIIKRNTPVWNINKNVFKASEIYKWSGSKKNKKSNRKLTPRDAAKKERRNRRIRKAIRNGHLG